MAYYIETHGNRTFSNRSNNESVFLEARHHPFVTAFIGDVLFLSEMIADGMYSLGFVANVMLVFYIIKYRRYRSPIFALILNLGISDSSSCVASFVWVTFSRPFVMGPDWVCNVSTFMTYFSLVGSNYTIAIISIIRFYQLVFPLSAHVNVTAKLIAKLCSLIWIKATVVSVSFGIVNGTMELDDSRGVFKACVYIGNHQHIYDGAAAFWCFLLPLLITIMFQFAKHCIVSKQFASAQLGARGLDHDHARESTDARDVLIVVVVYIIATLPLVGVFIAHFIRRGDHTSMPIAATITNKIYLLNSAINPFIYAFAAQTVRRDILAMLLCKARDKKVLR